MTDLNDKLRHAVDQYCAKVHTHIEELDSTVSDMIDAEFSASAVAGVASILHRMRGTAACLGFETLAAPITDLENSLRGLNGASDGSRVADLSSILTQMDTIRRVAAKIAPEDSTLLAKTAIAARAETSQSPSTVEGMTVVVADDDLTVRQLVRTILLNAGAKDVLRAANGDDALRMVRTSKPDLIISDLNMTPMNGFAFLKSVRMLGGDAGAAPFIMLTSSGDRRTLQESVRRSADSFVVKPFTAQSLLAHIEAVMKKCAARRIAS